MARSRNIKPALFKNEVLGVADPLYTLLFQSLWMLSDREGRLEDRPLRIKAETFPYRDNINVDAMLEWLQEQAFIIRYEYRENRYIQIVNFTKHQSPHKNEAESEIPCLSDSCNTSSKIGTTSSKIGSARADSLNLIPDSLNLIPDLPTSIDDKKNKASDEIVLDNPDDLPSYAKINQSTSWKTDTFQMSFDWMYSPKFEVTCKFAGKDIKRFTDDTLKTFIVYNMAKESYKTQKQWESLLLTWFSNQLAKPTHNQPASNGHSNNADEQTQPTHVLGQFDEAVKNRADEKTTKAHINNLKKLLSV